MNIFGENVFRLVEEDLIDDKVVADDLEWLAQTFDGENFIENGRVFSSQLMGGLNKDGNIAITAYTTIVFAENYENLSDKHKAIVDSAADSMAFLHLMLQLERFPITLFQ